MFEYGGRRGHHGGHGPGAGEWGGWAQRRAMRALGRAAWAAWYRAQEGHGEGPGPRGGGRGGRGPRRGQGHEWGREFERAFRGGFGGWGGGPMPPFFGGPGRWGPPGGPGERRFGRGDIKYLLLDLLRDRPMHGYEMIKELENRHAGLYAPSPGSVYPTLQLLEDREFVTAEMVDGKKVYTITASGRAFLDERAEHVEGLRGRGAQDWNWGPGFMKGMQAVGSDAWELGRLVMRAVQEMQDDPARLERVRRVLAHTREELEHILREGRQAGDPGPEAPGPGRAAGPTVV
ncbi:MAG: hypothetical protein NVSMB65_19380 [Chloroflexota bacterium]